MTGKQPVRGVGKVYNDDKFLAIAPFYILNNVNNNFGSAFQAANTISILTFVPGAG